METLKIGIKQFSTCFLFFFFSLFVNYNALNYSTRSMGNATTDILLENLPVVNTNIIFSYGAFVFVVFVSCLIISRPKTISFTIKSVSLFIIIRSLFVSMTHLAPYSDKITTNFESITYLSGGADLFFSGHTGLPFLIALIFWDSKILRYIFIICSVVGAIAVILGHLHYTIDVFSAYFISFGIYRLSVIFFPKDFKNAEFVTSLKTS